MYRPILFKCNAILYFSLPISLALVLWSIANFNNIIGSGTVFVEIVVKFLLVTIESYSLSEVSDQRGGSYYFVESHFYIFIYLNKIPGENSQFEGTYERYNNCKTILLESLNQFWDKLRKPLLTGF